MKPIDAPVRCEDVVDNVQSYGRKLYYFVSEPYTGLWFTIDVWPIEGIDKGKKYRVTVEEIPS